MQVIVCVDDGMGMLFNHRRQSRDRVLIQRILEITKGKQIFMNTYSAELFEGNENICIDDDFLKMQGMAISALWRMRHFPGTWKRLRKSLFISGTEGIRQIYIWIFRLPKTNGSW